MADDTVAYYSTEPSTPVCTIITPVGMLGYGLSCAHTSSALTRAHELHPNVPVALILDSGSTDSGPEKLALGCMSVPRDAYKRDLRKLVRLSREHHVPLIFSSAGGDGSDEHVREMVEVVRDIAEEQNHSLDVLSIFSEISTALVSERLRNNMVFGCGKSVPALTQRAIDATPRIVAQMGPEPILDAMLAHPDFDILIAGRAYDPAPYIAFAAFATGQSLERTKSLEAKKLWGGFAHMGKILECGGLCGVPKSNGAMATAYSDGSFDVTPLDPGSVCTPTSVAAHTLYEKARPDVLYGPGGHLELAKMKTEALEDGRSVRVQGGVFNFLKDEGLPYMLKLEGAEIIGYRTQVMGSFKDPILISQFEDYLERVREYVASQHGESAGTWELGFHVFGRHPVWTPLEIFLIGEALASTQELANSVASVARVALTHGPYEGQKATSGNFAFGLGGQMESQLGPCAQFSVYHLMQLEEFEERLRLEQSSPSLFTFELFKIRTPHSADVATPSSPSDSPEKTFGREEVAKYMIEKSQKAKLNPKTLGDIAKLIRSKNAGPFEVTLDVMFDSEAEYQLVKDSSLLSARSMSQLFDRSEGDLIWQGFFDQALAYKVTIPRLRFGKPTASGSFMENDVHASQQYIGFMNFPLPGIMIEDWNKLHNGQGGTDLGT